MRTPTIRKIEHFWYRHEDALRWATFVLLIADAARQIVIS